MSELRREPMTLDEAAHILARVRAQCAEEGACLIWTGYCKPGTEQPAASFPGRRGLSVRRAVYEAQHGKAPPVCARVTPACGHPRCLACLVAVSRSASQLAAAARGAYSDPVAVRNRALAARSRARYSEEQVRLARSTDAAPKVVAKATGMSVSYVRSIRRGEMRRPSLGVWAGLGSGALV